MSDDVNADAGAAGDTSATTADPDEAATVGVDSLGKTYVSDRRMAETLSDVEFAVEDGEFACIVDFSGCGKTALFHTIAGLEDATSDAVILDGSPVTGPGTDRGMVFQEYGLFPRRTVSENVVFRLGGQSVEEPARLEHMTEMPEFVSLDGFVDAYPKELSGRMKQHVGIARAPAVDLELFLMDGPFGVIDAQTRDTLHGELLGIWAEMDKTVLSVTHDVEEAVTLIDCVVVMVTNPGRACGIVSADTNRPRERTESELAAYIEWIRGLIGEQIFHPRFGSPVYDV